MRCLTKKIRTQESYNDFGKVERLTNDTELFMNVLKKSLLVSTVLLWGAYGTWAMSDDDETRSVSPHSSPEFSHNEPDEYERSNGFKSYAVEKRGFETFKNQCDENKKKRVMVFGANSSNGGYNDNIYKVDLFGDPDLLMNTDIDPLPEKYIGQFDVVVFECITSAESACNNYERKKAFPNVQKLLKDNGLFLVWTDNSDDIKDQREALESHGFSFRERIKHPKISLLGEIDENPPRSESDNIYLEPNGDEIKYIVIIPGDGNVEGTLNFNPNLSVLFSSHPERQSIETDILKELFEKEHISGFSNYKDCLGGYCISMGYADLLVMEKL